MINEGDVEIKMINEGFLSENCEFFSFTDNC